MKEIAAGKEVSHPMLFPTPPTKVKKWKMVSAEEAIKVIRDGDTVATGGFVGTGFAEEIAVRSQK
jgi:propionate CoA-transferase